MSRTVWIINHYASTPATGMGGRHFYLARELAKRRHKVYVIAEANHHLLREPVTVTEAFKCEQVDGVTFVWVKLPPYNEAHSRQRVINWFLFPSCIQKLSKLIIDKPDAVLCSSPSPISFLGAKRLAKRFQATLVFEVRDIWPLTLIEIGGYSSRHPFIRFMQWVEDKAYREADYVVSNLQYSVEHMMNRGMPRDKFYWVPNGFSLDEVALNVPLNENASSQLPTDKFIVGYTGTFGVANSLGTLIECADRLRHRPDIAFVLVGGGKERGDLERQVNALALDNVVFIDPVPKVEIQAMLNRFDVCFIGLTKNSLFRFGVSPNKLYDYLYSARPIVYAIDSGAYNPVEEAGAGIQVSAQNPMEVADAILQLASMSEAERSEMGNKGRAAALSQYEYGVLAEKLADILFHGRA